MKRKIIFTIIIAVIVIILGFSACRTTKAYTDENTNQGDPYNIYIGFYSYDIGGYNKGGSIPGGEGDNINWTYIDSHEYYYYIIQTNYQSTNDDFIALNFYSSSNKYFLQIITIVDGDTIYHKYNYEVNKDYYLVVAINPIGDEGYIYFKEYSISPDFTPANDNWQMKLSFVKNYNIIYDISNLGNSVELSLRYNSNYHSNYLYGQFELDNIYSYNAVLYRIETSVLYNIDRIINKGIEYGTQVAQYELEQQTALNYSKGYQAGLEQTEGYQTGYTNGYQAGVDDTMSGSSGVSPVLSLLTSLAAPINSIMSIRLAPNITIGTLIFIPLFFAALGLVLWIWRRN